MSEKKYYQDFDEYLALNPQTPLEYREVIEPVIQGADDDFFAFILSYIFM